MKNLIDRLWFLPEHDIFFSKIYLLPRIILKQISMSRDVIQNKSPDWTNNSIHVNSLGFIIRSGL